MSRVVNPANKLTKAEAAALAAAAGLSSAANFVSGTNVNTNPDGSPNVTNQSGTEKLESVSLPRTAAANNNVQITNRWIQVPVRNEGTVTESSYLDINNLAKYIPVSRIEEKKGPRYPDPLGNDLVISRSIFSFSYTGETLTRSSSRLNSPSTGATSVSGV